MSELSPNAANSQESRVGSIAIPDRLSVDPLSPYFSQEVLEKDVCIRFNGYKRTDVNEYCISEGWVTVAHPRSRDRKGHPLLVKLKGKVEAFFDDSTRPQ
jgi:hypothetical protein